MGTPDVAEAPLWNLVARTVAKLHVAYRDGESSVEKGAAMCMVQLLGVVLPLAAGLSIDGLPTTTWKSAELGLEMTFKIQIRDNNVVIDCELNKWSKEYHLMLAYMRALDTVRAIVDVASFSYGVGLIVILDQFVGPDGAKSALVPTQPDLAALSTAVKNRTGPKTPEDNHFHQVLKLTIANVPVFRALRELIDAISETHVSPVACGRAMEGLRHVIAPSLEPKHGWVKMREALQIDRSYLEYITNISTGRRHADPEHISGSVRHEITIRAWTIMNRFFEYLKRGSQPLPLSEFPTLK
jgi:hypothetical protein